MGSNTMSHQNHVLGTTIVDLTNMTLSLSQVYPNMLAIEYVFNNKIEVVMTSVGLIAIKFPH